MNNRDSVVIVKFMISKCNGQQIFDCLLNLNTSSQLYAGNRNFRKSTQISKYVEISYQNGFIV